MSASNTLTGVATVSAGSLKIASGATLSIGNGGTAGALRKYHHRGHAWLQPLRRYHVHRRNLRHRCSRKSGAGILTLTGANAHAGGTTINAGTLSIGNGGTTGSLSGAVTNSGTLVFNRSDDFTFAGVITGSGAINKLGAGILTLSGNNTLAGVTTVSAGSLKIASGATVTIGNGGTSGSLSGNVINEGMLGFNRSDSSTFAGAISSTGALAKSGAGTLTLTGNNTPGAGTTINAGTLTSEMAARRARSPAPSPTTGRSRLIAPTL